MTPSEKPSFVRRAGRLAARAGALTLSVGVVGFLMVRAGGLGCSASDDARREPGSAATTQASASGYPLPSAPQTEFIGGSKAWADPNLADKVLPSSEPSATATGTANPPPKPKPTFFPGTKSGDFHIDRANPPLDSQQQKK